MGTRADFYIGRDEKAEWLGSIAWDGYPDNAAVNRVFVAQTAEEFRTLVGELVTRKADEGWPWAWDDSRTTDWSYAFDDGRVWMSNWGAKYREATAEALHETDVEHWHNGPENVYPRHGGREQRVTDGGFLVFGVRR